MPITERWGLYLSRSDVGGGGEYQKIPEIDLLLRTFGISFQKPPEREKLTLLRTYEASREALELVPLTGTVRLLAYSILPFLSTVLHKRMGGLYVDSSHTFYERRIRRNERNVFGEREITYKDYSRFVSLHELTHGYLYENGVGSKMEQLLKIVEGLHNGILPNNLEPVITEGIWQEGMCHFAAISAEMECIRKGELQPERSKALQQRHYFLTGRKFIDRLSDSYPDPMNLLPDKVWLSKCRASLEDSFYQFQNAFNLKSTFKREPREIFSNLVLRAGVPGPGSLIAESIGYHFADRAFGELLSTGISNMGAFEHLVSHPPQRIYELSHPLHYVAFSR